MREKAYSINFMVRYIEKKMKIEKINNNSPYNFLFKLSKPNSIEKIKIRLAKKSVIAGNIIFAEKGIINENI